MELLGGINAGVGNLIDFDKPVCPITAMQYFNSHRKIVKGGEKIGIRKAYTEESILFHPKCNQADS